MISDFKVGQGINKEFLLTKIVERERKRGNDNFFELHFQDTSGQIEGREWNKNVIHNVDEGEVVHVRGEVVEYRNAPQIKVSSIRSSDGDPSDFIEGVVGDTEEYYQKVVKILDKIRNDPLRELCLSLAEKRKEKLKKWPAASGHHHAKVGGLIKHISSMMSLAQQTISHYHSIYDRNVFDAGLVMAGIFLHDFYKLDTIADPFTRQKTEDARMAGHISLALEGIAEYRQRYGDFEKYDDLRHIILSHHGKKEWGSPREPQIPEAKLIHRIDMMDSRMAKVMENAQEDEDR